MRSPYLPSNLLFLIPTSYLIPTSSLSDSHIFLTSSLFDSHVFLVWFPHLLRLIPTSSSSVCSYLIPMFSYFIWFPCVFVWFLNRYDYLEFIDEAGDKTRYDGKVGDDRWSSRVEFKGSKVRFSFHSDGSNNEWGYKFTVSSGCGFDVCLVHEWSVVYLPYLLPYS